MSSAPKGERVALDAYYTPDDVALACVRTLPSLSGLRVIEPSVGGGAFARAIAAQGPKWLLGIDINHEATGFHDCTHMRRGDDFMITIPVLGRPADWVIGNPPYTHAEAHVRHALTLAPRCAFLLRLAFLESVKRVDFWRDHQPSEVYILAKRPSFTGGGTDSAAYGWFVWDRIKPGPTRLDVLTPDGPLWGRA